MRGQIMNLFVQSCLWALLENPTWKITSQSVPFVSCKYQLSFLFYFVAVLFPRRLSPKLPIVNLTLEDSPITEQQNCIEGGNTHSNQLQTIYVIVAKVF